MIKERRYDIDWIRVIVFDILIIYHIGMFFVPWGWELKNNEIVEWLTWPMLVINRWRLSILFVISGMGTSFALSYRSGGVFALERLKRLFVPLLAGILIMVVPQVYLVRLSQGAEYSSYLTFYPDFFNGIYPEGNFSWMHLWFLPYLLLMSLLCIPLFLYLRKPGNLIIRGLKQLIGRYPVAIYIFIIPLFLAEVYLEPYYPITNALVGDWYALTHYAICFVSGFILICVGNEFWTAVKKVKGIALAIGIIAFPTMLWMWENYLSIFWIPLFASLNRWSWIIVIFGFAATYLNKESPLIKYRNQAVYPLYIMHQTVILIIGYYLMDSDLHYLWKFIILTIGTFGGCFLLYEFVIKRLRVLRPLFGLKNP